ncbi:sodium-translocating pyrophosphatase [Candidatus Nesciobacter abundans]|uniref:K(+)-insensitive pyrophosphate-energized proton pump n=1 Tax=Candidatus Nesciobacter abundans TaxID=2601668 RepID=A0A5C0UJH8_9PROT|nr:sodium-translocating pyrophosphatase [Candidatus Nesciobacter abundans]QEK38964.1 sodium-translocating pyrophosphatase [Candidatus Nesciobacter abundans]
MSIASNELIMYLFYIIDWRIKLFNCTFQSIAIFSGLFLFFRSYVYYKKIKNIKVSEDVNRIGSYIKDASYAYLKKQYLYVFVVSCVIALFLFFFSEFNVCLGFIVGAFLSSVCGIAGMHVAVVSNMRTAQKAESGVSDAFEVSFGAGKVTGLLIGGIIIFSVVFALWNECGTRVISEYDSNIMKKVTKSVNFSDFSYNRILKILLGMSFGASVVSVFARLGGGIFTKAADVGADLVGKIEKNIPEDDPRNPAVIADNVGDNVGDCAGTSADIFETYIVGFMAACYISSQYYVDPILFLIISLSSMLGSYIATEMFSRTTNPFKTMFKFMIFSLCAACMFNLVGISCYLNYMGSFSYNMLFYFFKPCAVGILSSFVIVVLTNYYTSYSCSPVKRIAKASESGHAMNIMTGLAVSLESCFGIIVCMVSAILGSYYFADTLGIAICIVSMLSIVITVMTLDAYGPITDNAGGIAEMSKMPASARENTDTLDALGNTTKALTKGYSIGSAALAASAVFFSYSHDLLSYTGENFVFCLTNPFVVSGMLIGGAIVYLYASMSIESVSEVGQEVVKEVQNQFAEDPLIIEGKSTPNYSRTVEMLTERSIQKMFYPVLVAVGVPLICFASVYLFFGSSAAFTILGGLISGVTIVGIFSAISMTNGGGAWDNAKKYIELGFYGGKGSYAHKAAVTGDTVGDPYKDTAGPAINPMMKMVNIIAIVIILLFNKYGLF